MKRSAFVTGGTGFLGSWLVCSLLRKRCYSKVFVLARPSSNRTAESRLRNILKIIPHHLASEALRKLRVVKGDVSQKNMGLTTKVLRVLGGEVRDIFHSAAIAEFSRPLAELRAANVAGTRNVVKFAMDIQDSSSSGPVHVHHVSTAAVAGDSAGWFGEDDFNIGQRFNNAYEQSKFEAERVIRDHWDRGLSAKIYRPAVITGDSRYGITTNFKMIYQPAHFLKYGLFKELPADEKCRHSFVPVDKVAEAIALLCDDDSQNGVFHLVNPHETTLKEYIVSACRVFKFDMPKLIPLKAFRRNRLSDAQWRLLDPFLPYLNYHVRFKADRTIKLLERRGFKWPLFTDALLERLFNFCLETDFMPPKNL